MACWSNRGCDDEMRGRCPHAIDESEQCPIGCHFAKCDRPTHRVTSDVLLMLDPSVDRTTAAKELCTRCEFFLLNGPRL